jgi:periplasmic divalent cation tolerance protein
MADYIVVLTTLGSEEEAASLARTLVERKLVACVNVLPGVRSFYRWEGSICDDREVVLIMKTRRERFEALSAAVEELHPYDVPELIALPLQAGAAAYLSWLDESTRP